MAFDRSFSRRRGGEEFYSCWEGSDDSASNVPDYLDEEELERQNRINRNSIFVGHVNNDATEEELKQHFHSCGSGLKVTFFRYQNRRTTNKFAYIRFEDRESVDKAMAFDGSVFRGGYITVKPHRKPCVRPASSSSSPFGRGFMGRGRGATAAMEGRGGVGRERGATAGMEGRGGRGRGATAAIEGRGRGGGWRGRGGGWRGGVGRGRGATAVMEERGRGATAAMERGGGGWRGGVGRRRGATAAMEGGRGGRARGATAAMEGGRGRGATAAMEGFSGDEESTLRGRKSYRRSGRASHYHPYRI